MMKKLLKTWAVMALLLPVTLTYGAVLHDAHKGTVSGVEGGGPAECSWHFVHNQIDKGKEGVPSLLEATFSGADVNMPIPTAPLPILKKVRHYDVATTGAGNVTLEDANDDFLGGMVEGKLLLSDVSCEPISGPACPCAGRWANNLGAPNLPSLILSGVLTVGIQGLTVVCEGFDATGGAITYTIAAATQPEIVHQCTDLAGAIKDIGPLVPRFTPGEFQACVDLLVDQGCVPQ